MSIFYSSVVALYSDVLVATINAAEYIIDE